MIKKWKKITTVETYKCGSWYQVDKDEIITPGGERGYYYVVRREPAVAIIPIDKNGFFYLTIQHRYTVNNYSIEVPGGFVEGKNFLRTAKKELEEEMQLKSNKWKKLGTFNEAVGLAEIPVVVYLALDVVKVKNAKKDHLDKNLHQDLIIPKDELITLIANCKINDSFTLAALAIAQAQGII